MLKKPSKRLFQEIDLKAFILLVTGTISWSITMVKSGLTYPFGLGFWGANGHDGIWHVALIRSIARDVSIGNSWGMPVFSGELLKNYHFGFDGLLAFIHMATQIPVSVLYFQIAPPILAFLVGVSCWMFVRLWRGDKAEAFWATFFVYFGGSFGWVVTFIRESKFAGESMFWSQQSISTLINPPFALSLIFLFCGLIAFIRSSNANKFSKLHIFSGVWLFGVLIAVKVYAGLLMLSAFFSAGLYLLTRRKDSKFLKIFIGVLIFSFVMFIPSIGSSGSLIKFAPFWFLETMLGISDRFNWPRLYEAIMNYKLGGVWYKLIPAYLLALVIFLVGNFGTRIVGIKYIFQKAKDIESVNWVDVFVVAIIMAGITVPLLFLQSGTPWNTIQFFYYSLIFLGILAGISLAHAKKMVIALVVLLTVPTTLATLANDFLPSRSPAKISHQELAALKFLEVQPNGIVLTYNFDEHKAKAAINNPPRPLYFYESTSYVSAYSNKSVYLEDQVNLDITGYNWRERRQEVEKFIQSTNGDVSKEFLEKNKIKYLYLVKNLSPLPGEILRLGSNQLELENIFENDEVVMFKVVND